MTLYTRDSTTILPSTSEDINGPVWEAASIDRRLQLITQERDPRGGSREIVEWIDWLSSYEGGGTNKLLPVRTF